MGKEQNRNLFIIITSLFFFLLLANFYFILKNILPIKGTDNLTNVQVSRIVDGDTFDIKDGERIRLYEINAPEYPKECMGEDAKDRLEDLLKDQTIGIERIGKDNFGRTLAYVSLNNNLINKVMLEEGLAYFEKGKKLTSKSLIIEQAEGIAKSTKRGVWSTLCLTKKEGCIIKGNYKESDHTRIFHTPDCYNYDRITIKPGTTDRWFCSETEAIAAGFRKSKDCPR